MRRLVTLTAFVLLAGAPTAQAKGTAEVCGANDCTTVTEPGDVGYLRSTFGPARAPEPAPFYVVRFCSRADCRGPSEWSYLYVPSARAMRADDIGSGPVRWMEASLLSSLIAELTKDLEPYPASPAWTPAASERAADASFPIGWIALVFARLQAIASTES